MTEYKLDILYGTDSTVKFHVFDINDESEGPLGTRSIGKGLDSERATAGVGSIYRLTSLTNADKALKSPQ